MTKKLSYEALEERISHFQDDIIAIAAQRDTLEAKLALVQKLNVELELDNFEEMALAQRAEDKWNELKGGLAYARHAPSCPSPGIKPHHACKCGWNFYATKLERLA